MKTILLVITLSLFSSVKLLGTIRNGYESDLNDNIQKLQNLKLQLLNEKDMSPGQKRSVKSQINNLVSLISYHQLTEEVIMQLKIFSPGMYDEIDDIRDKKGRVTDVYVRLIPKENSITQLRAASFFRQSVSDEDASVSKYGDYSVSIDIWISETALILLSHELGHVKYIVPNLATYSKFYEKQYSKTKVSLSYIGHSPRDESGKSAYAFQKRFGQDRRLFLQNGGESPQRLISYLTQVRKGIRDSDNTGIALASVPAAKRAAPPTVEGNVTHLGWKERRGIRPRQRLFEKDLTSVVGNDGRGDKNRSRARTYPYFRANLH